MEFVVTTAYIFVPFDYAPVVETVDYYFRNLGMRFSFRVVWKCGSSYKDEIATWKLDGERLGVVVLSIKNANEGRRA